MPGITIVGSGRHVPGRPIKNDELARVMDTSDEWIKPRSGIEQRHYVAEGEGVSDLAVVAAEKAIERARIDKREIDYVIFATMTPEHAFPGSGALLGAKLGIPGVPALDIRQQCAAMPFGMQLADGLVASGAAKTILLVGAEAHAGFMPYAWDALLGDTKPTPEEYEFATKHRGIAVLFGDGAGALVLRKSDRPGHGFIGAVNHSDGRAADQIWVPGGMFTRRHYWDASIDSHIPTMKGKDLFKSAVTLLPKVVHEVCDKHDVKLEDIDWFVAHQANDRINASVRQALGIAPDKVPSNIARYGNTSAGTIPILVDEMMRDGRLEPGQLVCFLALGAGLNWGSVLMRI
ncbi:3-oxoacyl-ACP synthase III family protein [Sandaracinus amylolyticus]|uniref:3-oxoacyl-[acyl-carrier-protein] synthase, KASIII n=1 Tax=Sandaracinus amylolyticus TaxID=927083 RepID=A0A0F6SH92_9BACT|nr:beta-ketoacyl-ACP synthase III [Sandaracinus amylolyticus]AKF10039.1 3-oxoacyl-[acyl-carrier-protein] synthase, KASIII [Sandaracinus amylolyticus]